MGQITQAKSDLTNLHDSGSFSICSEFIVMAITSSREVINEGLRSHLDQLASSVSYYYGKLIALELPSHLAEDLVIDWHKGKVQAWVEQQKPFTPPKADSRIG